MAKFFAVEISAGDAADKWLADLAAQRPLLSAALTRERKAIVTDLVLEAMEAVPGFRAVASATLVDNDYSKIIGTRPLIDSAGPVADNAE